MRFIFIISTIIVVVLVLVTIIVIDLVVVLRVVKMIILMGNRVKKKYISALVRIDGGKQK